MAKGEYVSNDVHVEDRSGLRVAHLEKKSSRCYSLYLEVLSYKRPKDDIDVSL